MVTSVVKFPRGDVKFDTVLLKMNIMVIRVLEFSSQGYKIRNYFYT